MSEYKDHSAAIEKGVYNWLEAHQEQVMEIIQKSTDKAVEWMAAGCMAAVGKFFEDNKDDLKAGIATACALSWNEKHSSSYSKESLKDKLLKQSQGR